MTNPRRADQVAGDGLRAALGSGFLGALAGLCLLLPLHGVDASEEAVRMEVRQVAMDPVNRTPVVVLAGAGRVLPIWIGTAEASSIARALAGERLSRPDTHDLIGNLLERLGAKPERVTITELRENTFFAVITLKTARGGIEMDSRPSDAIAVALRTGTPIYATAEVLEQSVSLDHPALRPDDRVASLLGMHVQDMTAELARLFATRRQGGVLVAHVERDSPASKYGVRRGDVITGVDRRAVRNIRELKRILGPRPETRARMLHIQRDGEPVTIVVGPPSQEKP